MNLNTIFVALISSSLAIGAKAEPPTPPQVSSFAPADDLIGQVRAFITTFDAALGSEQDFSEKKDQVKQNAHALAVVAVALGLHDTPNELKASAPALLAAAQALAKAGDYAAAGTALGHIKAALEGKSKDGPQLKWEHKVASLGQLMKQATSTDARLRRNLKRFDRLAADNAQSAALLAVIAQAAIADTHEVKDPADLPKWYQWAGEMRDSAAGVNRAIKAKDPAAADAAAKRLMQSCDDCHAVFQTE
jgi:hypothetical protein